MMVKLKLIPLNNPFSVKPIGHPKIILLRLVNSPIICGLNKSKRLLVFGMRNWIKTKKKKKRFTRKLIINREKSTTIKLLLDQERNCARISHLFYASSFCCSNKREKFHFAGQLSIDNRLKMTSKNWSASNLHNFCLKFSFESQFWGSFTEISFKNAR